MPLLPTLHAISAVHCPLGFVQQVTAIIQAPGFDSLSPCAQNIVVAVIDDSKSPECPGGSPPYCFCGAEAASQEYFDQISTNILKSCLTSPQPEAMQAAAVFAAYCSLGDAMTAGTTAASSSSPTSSSSSYSLSSSSSEARTTTSSAAQGASSISTSTSGPTSSSNGGGGLDTNDIVARGVNISGTVETIVGGIGSILGSPPRPTSSSNDSTTSSGNGGRGLNTGDKVGLGIGIPATVAGIIAAYYAYKTYMLSKKQLAVGMHSWISPQARYGAHSRYATGPSEVRMTPLAPPAATYSNPARDIVFATEEGPASSPLKEGCDPSCAKDPTLSYTPSFSQEGSAPSPSQEGSAPEPVTSSTEEGSAPEPIASPLREA